MSPAPQGGLEVERYIGSCLISQSAHTNNSNKQHHPNKGKKTGDHHQHAAARPFLLNPREPPPPPPPHGHGHGPRYPLPPLHGDIYPHHHHQHQHHQHQHQQHGWAGMPLFCMASSSSSSSNQRKNRKGGPAAAGNRGPKMHHQSAGGGGGYQNKNLPDPQDAAAAGRSADGNRSPLSRLAIHTQGAPLIQAGRYNRMGYGRNVPPPLRLYRGGDLVTRRAGSPKAVQAKEPGTCDSVSIASDESSANSENSLPRIIKPRKRRKKDRKPPPPPQQQQQQQQQQQSQSHLLAPVSNPDPDNVSAASKASTDSSSTGETTSLSGKSVLEAEAAVASSLLQAGANLGDDLPPGLDQDQDHEEDEPGGLSTTCQCRYCDPAGVIWDVDRRCYSPFLTPPSPAEPKLQLSYGLRSYDLGTALRRSWSEPSSGPPDIKPPPRTRTVSESPSQGLEVSSEIITSPNGHRDIEIKFYSAKSGAAGARQFKVEE